MYKINLKPIVKWAGGKRQIMQEIDDRIKKINNTKDMIYVEPFLGGASVFIHVISQDLFNKYIISDINGKLINLYIQVKENIDILLDKLESYKKEYLSMESLERKEYYYRIREEYNKTLKNDMYMKTINSRIDNAAMFLFLNKTCFNGLYRENNSGYFNVPMGGYKNPSIYDEENMLNLSKALNMKDEQGEDRVIIMNEDYKYFSTIEFDKKNTFMYCDPPYRPITKGGFNSYHKSDFNDKEQMELAEFYKKMSDSGTSILLSNSDPKNLDPEDEFFDELYEGFKIERIYAKRMINANKNGRGAITEILIRNYE